jgi:hypothetical protein
MIPILAAAPLAASLVNGLFQTFRSHPAPPAAPNGPDFSKHLEAQMKAKDKSKNIDQAGSVQSLIALQKSMGPLQPEVQVALAQQLLNQTVQVHDTKGNNVVGTATDASWKNGQMHLTIKGQSYPLTSLQAVLHGVRT